MDIIIINKILKSYKNNLYEIKKIKDVCNPIKVDIKDSLIEFLMYIWHENNNDDFCKKLFDIILIPSIDIDFANFKSLKDYFDIHCYIKYNIEPEYIKLKNEQAIVNEQPVIVKKTVIIKKIVIVKREKKYKKLPSKKKNKKNKNKKIK